MCDQISDAVLDAHLKQDPDAKVACGKICFPAILDSFWTWLWLLFSSFNFIADSLLLRQGHFDVCLQIYCEKMGLVTWLVSEEKLFWSA